MRALFWRSNLTLLALALVVLAGGDLYSWRAMRNQAQDAGFEELAVACLASRSRQPDVEDCIGAAPLAVWSSPPAAPCGVQVTVIRRDGLVLADSADFSGIAGQIARGQVGRGQAECR